MFLNAFNFNQDISGWCVEQIPIEPSAFSGNCPLLTEYQPLWGEECFINVEDRLYEYPIKLYPNPAVETIHMTFDNNYQIWNSATLTIKDINGRIVLVKDVNSEIIDYSFDISTLKDGLYVLVLKNKHIEIRRKFVKTK
jgi:hypothetical protein